MIDENINLERTEYENDKRVYVIDGERFFSVTSKLGDTVKKGELFYKFLGSADSYEYTQNKMKEAGSKGTKVHDYCEEIANGEKVNYLDEVEDVRSKVVSFEMWMDNFEPEILDTEFVVLCKEYNYAGRADLLAKIDDNVHLIDLKTSKYVYDSHRIQLMFYQYGLEEMGYNIDKINVLRLKGNIDDWYQFEEVDYNPDLVDAHNKIFSWKQKRDKVGMEKT